MTPRRRTRVGIWPAVAVALLGLAAFVQPGFTDAADVREDEGPLVNQVTPTSLPPRPAPAQIPGGSGQMPATSARVTGTVTYRERLALTPNAVVQVSLLDVSRADAPAVVLGEQTITTGGAQVPIPFEIAYDPAAIDERMTYAVRARITIDGQLLFTSTSATLVITRGRPTDVEIVVQRA